MTKKLCGQGCPENVGTNASCMCTLGNLMTYFLDFVIDVWRANSPDISKRQQHDAISWGLGACPQEMLN